MIDMGEPKFNTEDLPKIEGEEINKNIYIPINDQLFRFTVVSMGNSHAITFVENVDDIPLEIYGPIIENHPKFPNKTNVEFVEVKNKNNLKMRMWKIGIGEAKACDIGASAAVVASGVNGYTDENVEVELPEQKVKVEWRHDNHIYAIS